MNSDLEQFSEERLKLFELKLKYPTWEEISALARIAKQAKPVYQIQDADGWQDCEKEEFYSLIQSQGIHPTYYRVLFSHSPAPDLMDHCKQAAEIVQGWPEWKQRGADVTKFQTNKN